jgi:hypothetical protein
MQERDTFDHHMPHTVRTLLIRKRANHQVGLGNDARYFGEVLADHHQSSKLIARANHRAITR